MKTATKILMSAFIILAMLITSCADDEVNLPPGNVTLTSPANNSTEAPLNTELTWQAATDAEGDAIVYDVYFGETENSISTVSRNQTGTSYSPTLIANTTYYWKVIAKDQNGDTSQSNVRSFSTLNNGSESSTLLAPVNEATGIAMDVTLTWDAVTDPDGDAVTYDVYFGTEETPATIVSADQSETFHMPTLESNTMYYWRIVAKDNQGGESESAIWSFTTLNNAPESVTLTAPANAASDVALDASLTWDAAIDPDGDAVTYDVYLGIDETPATIVSANQTELSYAPTLEIATLHLNN